MNKTLIRSLSLLALLSSLVLSAYAQTGNNSKSADTNAKPAETPAAAIPTTAITATATPIELAKAALAAQ
ncbi:MAG TPA: hypothetical protein VIW64_02740, partial [Pyrinomonadaceae bacterium]